MSFPALAVIAVGNGLFLPSLPSQIRLFSSRMIPVAPLPMVSIWTRLHGKVRRSRHMDRLGFDPAVGRNDARIRGARASVYTTPRNSDGHDDLERTSYCHIYCQIRGFRGISGDTSPLRNSNLLIPLPPSPGSSPVRSAIQ